MIDVKEIFNKNLNFDLRCDKELQEKITNWILHSSKILVTEVLKEAADSAKTKTVEEYYSNEYHYNQVLNKESITSVINQVKF